MNTVANAPARGLERFHHEGVEGLRVGRFDLGISSSCIVYRLGSLVVDTGPPNQWRTVRRFLRERSVRDVLITHHHEDHSGNGARLRTELGARVRVPADGVELVRTGFALRPYQRVIWGAPVRFEAEPLPDRVEADDGVVLQAVPAPGHSADMTCFLEPNRGWLFTGDLYIASRPRFSRADEGVGQQIDSLRRTLALDFGTIFCAHRGVVPDGPGALRAKLDYLVSLRERVRALHGEGMSARAITRRVLGPEPAMSWITGMHFSKRNLVLACLRPDGDPS